MTRKPQANKSTNKPTQFTDNNALLMNTNQMLERMISERDLCRNDGANEIAELLDEAATKMKRLIFVLDEMACDYEHYKRKDMVEKAGWILCEVGAWRKVEKGEFARGGVSYGVAKPSNIPSSATPQAGLEPRKRNGGA